MLNNLSLKVPYFKIFAGVLFFNTALILIFIFLQSYLPPIIPLYYGLPKGESQLASKIAIVIPPTVSILITVINVFFVSLTKDEFIHKLLISISAVVTLLSTVTTIRIIMLVGSI